MADTKYNMERIDAMEGHEFEHFIAALLRNLGYESVEVTPGSGDQGVDVLAEKDSVRYAIQCKCYSSDLGNGPVQEVNTGKVIYQCHVGVVVTNRYFTQGAKDAAKATGILLWDRDRLQKMIAQAQGISIIELPVQQKNDAFMLWSGNPLLKRGEIALRDKEWKKARQFFDRVLNTDPKNAEAYLGLVMVEAELSDTDDFTNIYINNPFRLSRLNQNNLRHAKEFAGKELNAWFMKLETQQKELEVQRKKKAEQSRIDHFDTNNLTKAQKQNEEYKQLILSWLSYGPRSSTSIIESLKRVYSYTQVWSDGTFAALFNALIFEGKITHVEGSNGVFTLTEAERKRREAEAEDERKRKQAEDEAERHRQEELRAEAERRRLEEFAKKKAELEAEQVALQAELANVKGLFTGRRRREIEEKLKKIEERLRGCAYEEWRMRL